MVAHLRAVEHPLVGRIDAEVERLPGRFCHVRHRGGDVGELIADVVDVVLWPEVLVLGPRVRDHLLLGVEALGDLQRHVAREAIPVAGLGEQVVELEKHRRGLRLDSMLHRHGSRPACCLGGDLGSPSGAADPCSLVACCGSAVGPPLRRHDRALAEVNRRDRLPVGLRDEGEHRSFTLHDHGKRRRLNSAGGCLVKPATGTDQGGEGTGDVDADQPVGDRAALPRGSQSLHRGVGADVLEGPPDAVPGHRLQPESAEGLAAIGVFDDLAEDQLPFTTGVAGIDHSHDVGPRQKDDQMCQPFPL